MSDKKLKSIIRIEYFEGVDSQRSPDHNWSIFLSSFKIGEAHLIREAIKYDLGEFEDTTIHGIVHELVMEGVKEYLYIPSHPSAPDRKPDYIYRNERHNYFFEFWWKEMVMYRSSDSSMSPIQYDPHGDCIDSFSHDEGCWITEEDEVTKAFKDMTKTTAIMEVVLKDKTYVELLNDAANTLDLAYTLANTELDITTASTLKVIKEGIQSLIIDFNEDF